MRLKFLVAILLCATAAFAQDTTYISIHAETAGAPIPWAVLRLQPGNFILTADANGDFNFDIAPGAYTATLTATGYATQSFAISAAKSGLSQTVALTPGGADADTDGDGLIDSAETAIYQTSPLKPDTDGDGMSDLFEIQTAAGKALANPNDDDDADHHSNLEESLDGSDPLDRNSPQPTLYVSAASGNDSTGTGAPNLPFRTISKAIAAGLAAGNPAAGYGIVIFPGTYNENIVLPARYELRGPINGSVATIQGRVETNADSAVRYLTIEEGGASPKQPLALLSIDAANVEARNLILQGLGPFNSSITGIYVSSNAVSNAVITDCQIRQTEIGLDIQDDTPFIRRNTFFDIGFTNVQFENGAHGDKGLGRERDANTGWNKFRQLNGKAVDNRTNITFPMENNDWDTDSADAIDNAIDGPADFQPFLPKAAGLLPASIVCSVTDAVTREAITTAAVALNPNEVDPVTANVQGVYTFAAIEGNNYTVTVTANGFAANTQTINLANGESKTLLFPMQVTTGGGGTGCNCGAKDLNRPTTPQEAAGDMLLIALAAAACLGLTSRKTT